MCGIGYAGTPDYLDGPVNDVKRIHSWLLELGFHEQVLLTDFAPPSDIPAESHGNPTHENLVKGLRWLAHNSLPGDALFFYYSGHGASLRDRSGDEVDHRDEALVPSDHTSSGFLIDSDIARLLVRPLPEGVRLTALLDCCHSGTALDLPYALRNASRPYFPLLVPCGCGAPSYPTKMHREPRTPTARADVRMISGSEDAQVSHEIPTLPFRPGRVCASPAPHRPHPHSDPHNPRPRPDRPDRQTPTPLAP